MALWSALTAGGQFLRPFFTRGSHGWLLGPLWRGVALTTCVAVGSACSSLSWGLRFADYLLVRRVDAMFDLDRSQIEDLKACVDTELGWLKREIFPALAAELEVDAARFMRGPVGRDEFYAGFGRVRAIAERVILHALEPAARFLARLKPSQAQSWEEWHARETRWIAELRQLAFDDRRRDLRKGASRRIEFWFDDASDAQLDAWEELAILSDAALDKLARQKLESRSLVREAIALHRDEPSWRNLLEGLWLSPAGVYSPDAAAVVTRNLSGYADKAWAVLAEATPEQRQYLGARLRSIAADLRSQAL